MKTKLLRKVRKRYSITYWPNGINHGAFTTGSPVIFVEDTNRISRKYFCVIREDISYDKAYEEAFELVRSWIREDYPRKIKKGFIKLWYKRTTHPR